jgi:hypothetical protein
MSDDVVILLAIFLFLYLIIGLANGAQRRREQQQPHQGLAMISYLSLGLLYFLAVAIGLAVQGADVLFREQPELLEGFTQNATVDVPPIHSLALVALGLWAPGLLGILLLLPLTRRLIARFTAIDAASPVHAVALSMIALVGINLLTTLGVGLGALAAQLEQAGSKSNFEWLVEIWGQQILMAIFGLIGVGWLTRRNWRATLQRLKIVRPTLRQILFGIGLAWLLVPIVFVIEYISSQYGWVNTDVEKLMEQLLGPVLRTPLGVVSIGVAAALGEETLLRGALQPRFGLFFTSFIFALLHAQYGLSVATLIVFLLGLLLGVIRNRYNTTTSMVVHAVYNSTLALLAYLNVSF